MVKQDFYGTKKIFRKFEHKFGDNSKYLLELANKINEEAIYQMLTLREIVILVASGDQPE
ncbi:MAG: hypothetical protein ACFFFT_05550 [Candidatus Thorarchaeota archaeon]